MTENFTEEELQCKCGCGKCDMNPAFLRRLQVLRDIFAKPLVVTSGYRCKEYNKKLEKSAPKSLHCLGRAVDLKVSNNIDRFKVQKIAFLLGMTGVATAGNFVHIDLRIGIGKSWVYY